MSDWSLPTLTSLYTDFLTFISGRLNDAATMFNAAASNLPVHSIRWNRSTNILEEWDGTTWNALLLGLTGGGTTGNSASSARGGLGLGTISTQDANAVTITGGNIGSAVVVDAFVLANVAGYAPIAALGSGGAGAGLKALFDDHTWKVITSAFAFLTKSANYTILNTDVAAKTIILTTNTITLSLPTTNDVTIDGYTLIIKNVGTGTITVNPNGGDTIDGAASLTIPAGSAGARFAYSLVCNKTAGRWEII